MKFKDDRQASCDKDPLTTKTKINMVIIMHKVLF